MEATYHRWRSQMLLLSLRTTEFRDRDYRPKIEDFLCRILSRFSRPLYPLLDFSLGKFNSLNDSPRISETSSHSPPNINHCCYECGDPLDGIFCKRCTCKSCGKDAHIGYNCPSKVPVVSIPEPCNNQTIDELPQALPIFHPTFHSEAESPFTLDSTPTYVDESPNVFNPPPQPPVYPCEFYGNDAYFGHYCTPQASFIYPEPCYNQNFNFSQNFKNVAQQ
nr:hypothetical protein [Tanacetum cinerariifolium]